jgi:hypothetical protein
VALRDANPTARIQVEPRATEWLENSCDCGRPGSTIRHDFGALNVHGLSDLGDNWWPRLPCEVEPRGGSATLAALADGGRETEASIDLRCSQLLQSLQVLPQTSVAIVVSQRAQAILFFARDS